MIAEAILENEEPEQLRRLQRDLLDAARILGPAEVRYLVDGYYALQGYRVAAANQVRALSVGGEPSSLLVWLADQTSLLEGWIRRALLEWVEEQRPGRWALSQKGIGPVLAAGLLAHIDIEKAPTVGHIWRFAGLDPTVVWSKGEKRPWNARLKVICWKAGDSFVKQSGRPDAFYGALYRERKAYELERDLAGGTAEAVEATLASGRKLTENQHEYYDNGKLPPGRLDLRARRWAVKIYLAHLHHVLYVCRYDRLPPKPYVLDHVPGHAHMIEPPGWPCP